MSGGSPCWSCLARTLPSTTGSTISRCDGLAVSDRWIRLLSNSRSRRRAEMVFDVAGAFDRVRIGRAALEFMEQRAVRLAHHLGQHVEAAAMRHAEHDFLHAEIAAALDDLLQRRDQRFSAVEAEALGAGELEVAEFLKAFGLDQLVEDRAAALAGETDFLVRTLDALLDPGLLRGVGDVHELDAERLAVGALADRDDFAQACRIRGRARDRGRSCGRNRLR